MSFCFLNVNEDDNLKKINIDELFEKKKMRDQKQVAIFNKILNRIHTRITITGRTKRKPRFVHCQPRLCDGVGHHHHERGRQANA